MLGNVLWHARGGYISGRIHEEITIISCTPVRDMSTAPLMTKDALIAAYTAKYPRDDEGATWLAGEFAGKYADLRGHCEFLRTWLECDSGLSAEDKKARDVPKKGNTGNDKTIMELVHSLRRSDAAFAAATQDDIETTLHLAVLHRECRRRRISCEGMLMDHQAMRAKIFADAGWVRTTAGGETARQAAEICALQLNAQGHDEYLVRWADGTVSWTPKDGLRAASDLLAAFEGSTLGAACRAGLPGRRAVSGTVPAAGTPSAGLGTATGPVQGAGAGIPPPAVGGPMPRGDSGEDTAKGSFLITCLTQLAQHMSELTGKRKRDDADGDLYDGKLPGQRAVLDGHRRKALVGFKHFEKERNLKRTKNISRWPAHKPFASEFNETLGQWLSLERVKLETELQIQQLSAREGSDPKALLMKQAKLELLEEQWMVFDDKMELLEACNEEAEKGEWAIAVTMWEDAKLEQEITSASKAVEKRKKAAMEKLKDRHHRDQALYLAEQLGGRSAFLQDRLGHQARQFTPNREQRWLGDAMVPPGAPPGSQH